MYISLFTLFVKNVNNFNKTWQRYIEYADSEFRSLNLSYVTLLLFIWILGRQNILKLQNDRRELLSTVLLR